METCRSRGTKYKYEPEGKSQYVLYNILIFLFQSIELWGDGENGELDISVKLYIMKANHMVSALHTFLGFEDGKYLIKNTMYRCILKVLIKFSIHLI